MDAFKQLLERCPPVVQVLWYGIDRPMPSCDYRRFILEDIELLRTGHRIKPLTERIRIHRNGEIAMRNIYGNAKPPTNVRYSEEQRAIRVAHAQRWINWFDEALKLLEEGDPQPDIVIEGAT